MRLPENGEVKCLGISQIALTILEEALQNGHVQMVHNECRMWGKLKQTNFDYIGFRYEVHSEFDGKDDVIYSVEKIARVDMAYDNFNDEFLSGETLIVEDYRLKRAVEENLT